MTLTDETASGGKTRWRHTSALFLTAAVLPIIATNLCYLVSAWQDLIPRCITYLDGCTSISASGRYGVAYWLFKAAMLPQAALLWWFWSALAGRLDETATEAEARTRGFVRAGHIGALFLVLYVIFLGADNEIYRVLRRYGVFVYFIGTFVAMVLVTRRLRRRPSRRTIARALTALCAVMLVLGLAEIPLGTFGLEDHQAENIIEWNFALLMQFWFLVIWVAFGRRGAQAT